mmetsp:Transcript_17603/g.44647  ORF Transcript_17603/g.44647 Transcript_17603/m.44647 type:complete len:181 (+) Transcript_17603:203-745(+)
MVVAQAAIRSLKHVGDFYELLEKERPSDFVVLLDVFRRWAGPCTVMERTYSQLADAQEQAETRLALASVAVEDLTEWFSQSHEADRKAGGPGSLAYDGADKANGRQSFRGLAAIMSPAECVKLEEALTAASASCKPHTILLRCRPAGKTEFPVSLAGLVHGADAPAVELTFKSAMESCVF